MKGHTSFRLAIALLMSMALVLSSVSTAATKTLTFQSPLPMPPPNDNFASATVVSALPFSDTVDITFAGIEEGEPQPCDYSPQTVWYSYTPSTNVMIRVNLVGSGIYEKNLRVYQSFGPGFGGLSYITCTAWDNTITLNVLGGTTYYFQAGSLWDYRYDTLQIHIEQVPPPPNDNWVNATVITGLPFDESLDATVATREAGEPTPSCAWSLAKTVWYTFEPQETRSVSAWLEPYEQVIGVYTGDSINALTEVGCHTWGGRLTLRLNAGTKYYVQVGDMYGGSNWWQFHVDYTPPPVASFYYNPYDPSIFDTVQFWDNSYDPGEAGFKSWSWDLGDGQVATGQSVSHNYAADTDYTVKLTVVTNDDRTASTSQVVRVKTHDVAITRFTAPQSAKVGQTRSIAVDVNSRRYVENVQVQLYKSTPGGYQLVGTLNQQVPVRPSNRTTSFNFSYTFTNDDATMGKVTFRAVASLMDARDALPADNEAIASPTKVSR